MSLWTGRELVVAHLQARLRENCSGVRWMRARRPAPYGPLTRPTGRQTDMRTARKVRK